MKLCKNHTNFGIRNQYLKWVPFIRITLYYIIHHYAYFNISFLLIDEPPDEGFFNGPIEPDQPLESVRPTPYSLPVGFRWDTLNVNDSAVLKELYTLLNENYVEDEDSMFRFDYQPDFLKWFVPSFAQ